MSIILDPDARAEILSKLIGMPYRKGAAGPDAYDCYGLARAVQERIFGREMPPFSVPEDTHRMAIAAMIAAHPERARWVERAKPEDGALVTMARHLAGYHLGVWLDIDDGIVIHAIESPGVVVSRLFELEAEGWRKFRFHIPSFAPPSLAAPASPAPPPDPTEPLCNEVEPQS